MMIMKQSVILLILAISLSASEIKESEVPSKILNSYQKKFGNSKTKWMKHGTSIEAVSSDSDRYELKVTYDIKTERMSELTEKLNRPNAKSDDSYLSRMIADSVRKKILKDMQERSGKKGFGNYISFQHNFTSGKDAYFLRYMQGKNNAAVTYDEKGKIIYLNENLPR
ncbi:MAG TPA: hypothetical protein PK453_05715 [Leptospiraceae bacterium]|nr:hypothetical protein [Leptospiraceae bacterium]HNF13147.1 hypothetical protein [Leptospiraceae bacterium]HNF24391.1 hypothetical protein [Leptospiraceae bacterium]HNH07758.1 hypothetical protein [Leptospiraceae bacterium]HNM06423.1 hypothetical protein [Leptospiraceae bacterium]